MDDRAAVYAESAGIAFQLTNILRDLREDANNGRIYLPQEDLSRFGYDVEQLCRFERDDRFRALMRFQVDRARRYYEGARPLFALLPPPGRAVFQVLLRTYRGLLEAIEKCDYDVFSRRVTLSGWHKLGLVVRAVPTRLGWVTADG
jgi:phytoene synthase